MRCSGSRSLVSASYTQPVAQGEPMTERKNTHETSVRQEREKHQQGKIQTLKQAILSGMLRFITSRYDAYPLRIQVQRGRHADGLRRHGIRHDPRAPRFRSDPHTPECARPALPVAPSTLVAVALLPPDAPQE